MHYPPQSGIDVGAGQQLAVPVGGAAGRYVLVHTGAAAQGQMSLEAVQVYAVGACSSLLLSVPLPPSLLDRRGLLGSCMSAAGGAT